MAVSREAKVHEIAVALGCVIRANPGMCCFGEHVTEQGEVENLVVGFDGFIDLKALAEWVYVRMG